MSRMAALSLIVLAGPAHADMIKTYRERTSVEPRCRAAQSDEILVCGRRDADRWRLPLTPPPTPGDPKARGVPEERARLIAVEDACERRSAYVYGCGMVGVTVSTKIGSGAVETRPLAK